MVTVIVALGLVVLSSASEANGVRLHNDAYYFMKRQFMYLVVGLIVAVVTSSVDYRIWRNHPSLTYVFLAVVLVLLVAVFGFKPINGSHRWISLGPIRLQPSELAKLITVIVVSVWLDKAAWRVELFMRGAFWPAVIIGIIALPILLEPDFGSVMVVGLVGFTLMFIAGVRLKHMAPFALLGLGVFVYKVATNANRMARIAAYFGVKLNIGAEVMDEAAERATYQVKQALVAIKNGGITGVGLNQSMQKHFYLPEAHTDFIFAIGAEELGLCFSAGAIILFVLFFALSVYIAKNASDRFGRFLVLGMTFIIFFQTMFNIGVVCEAFPTKGMALPFFSYGGTNLVSAFFAVGTILSVGIHSYRDGRRAFVNKVLMRG